MRLFYFPDWITILSYIFLWPLMQVSIIMIGNKISDIHFDPNRFWLKTRRWEDNGDFYKRVFQIHKWKHLLPDGAKTHAAGFQKKHLRTLDPVYIQKFIAETGRAEIFHWLQIVPFWIFGLWSPFFVIWIMLGYALIVNLPCIIAQRYNRPRLIHMYEYYNKATEKC